MRKEIGPIATPDVIQWAPGLPKTRSGKIMRRILRKIAENDFGNLGDTSTLADPAVVDDLVKNRSEDGNPTIQQLAADLAAGRTTSRKLTEQALARIADPKGEGGRAFIKVWRDQALAAADASDALRKAGLVPSPLAGIPVSIKNLCDVAGETTLAGSKALDDAPPAKADAPVVARLRAAGAVIVGSTNMSEFAFSGVGFNPHYGTPGNPADRKRVPGGSSAGAAVSVADGMAVAALGTDTGGSVRIPAAVCGITGFKPTARRVPIDGVVPLSTSLDSIGPLANSVECCAIVDAVFAGEPIIGPCAGAAQPGCASPCRCTS